MDRSGPGEDCPGDAARAAVPPADPGGRDDAAAINACLAGRSEAFAEIVARHQARVYGLALRWTGRTADAADLTQEAFLRAFAALPRFDADRPFIPWLMRIAVNLCRDWRRRNRGRGLVDDPAVWESIASEGPGPPDRAEAGERRAAVRQAVAQLPPESRLLIVLAYDEGLSLRDVAAAAGLPLSMVKNRLFRARRRLARVLGHLAPERAGAGPLPVPPGRSGGAGPRRARG